MFLFSEPDVLGTIGSHVLGVAPPEWNTVTHAAHIAGRSNLQQCNSASQREKDEIMTGLSAFTMHAFLCSRGLGSEISPKVPNSLSGYNLAG